MTNLHIKDLPFVKKFWSYYQARATSTWRISIDKYDLEENIISTISQNLIFEQATVEKLNNWIYNIMENWINWWNDLLIVEKLEEKYNKELVCINHSNVTLFLEDEGNLEEITKDKDVYYEESNYFHFLTLSSDRDTLEKRYCHHDEANLKIEELEELESLGLEKKWNIIY